MANEYLNNKTFEGIIADFQKLKREKTKQEMIIEDLLSTKAGKRLNALNERIAEYKSVCSRFATRQDDLVLAFYTLAENIVSYTKFSYLDRDDAVQEGVMICFAKVEHFDASKGKAFNYMTTCILNHFRQLYRSAKGYQELKGKYLAHLYHQLDNVFKGCFPLGVE